MQFSYFNTHRDEIVSDYLDSLVVEEPDTSLLSPELESNNLTFGVVLGHEVKAVLDDGTVRTVIEMVGPIGETVERVLVFRVSDGYITQMNWLRVGDW